MSEPDISTLARRLAEQNNVDWRSLIGTGPGGKVVERDVLDYLARVMAGDEALDPTPEPLPQGMEAWPDQDAPSYFSAKPPAPAPSAPEPVMEPGDRQGVYGQGVDGQGVDDASEDSADDDLLSDDIFLFDEDGDEGADYTVAAPFGDEAPQRFAEPSPAIESDVVDSAGDVDDALLVADEDETFDVADEVAPAAPEETFPALADGGTDGASLFDEPYDTFTGDLTTGTEESAETHPGLSGTDWGGDDLRLGGDPFEMEEPDAEPLPDLWAGDEAGSEEQGADDDALDFGPLTAGPGADDALETAEPEEFSWDRPTAGDGEPDALEPEPLAAQPFGSEPLGTEPFGSEPLGTEPGETDAGEADGLRIEPLEEETPDAEPSEADDGYSEGWSDAVAADDVLDLEDAEALDELDSLSEVEALDGPRAEPAVTGAAPLPLVRTGTVLRRHVDLSALAAAQLAAGLELGNGEPLSPAPFLLRAVAKAAGETDGLRGQVALADLRGELMLRRVDDAVGRPFAALVDELNDAGLEEDEVGLVAVDLSGFDVDEVLLDLDVPAVTLGRIMYDTQRGAYRSTLALTGDLPLEKGAALLGRVAELLDAPVRLLL